MNLASFLDLHRKPLEAFARMSRAAGVRPDLVQGGGGNTSVKLDDNLMAIKASGYRLDDITPDNAYALLDYARIRAFYHGQDASGLDDVEKAGSEAARQAAVPVDGLPALRPSVEAGFHSLLRRYVLHTHPVYANLACCCAGGEDIIREALRDAGCSWVFLPYINPGAGLTFAMRAALAEAEARTGSAPSVIFMQNHGLVVTHDDPDTCAALHEDICLRLAKAFHVDVAGYPVPALTPSGPLFLSRTPFLADELRAEKRGMAFFTEDSLYPDQMVYLTGELELRAGSFDGRETTASCTIFEGSGEVVYACPQPKAQAMEETLVAVMYIHKTLRDNGLTAAPMSGAGKQFIAGWESEAYRKTLNATKEGT